MTLSSTALKQHTSQSPYAFPIGMQYGVISKNKACNRKNKMNNKSLMCLQYIVCEMEEGSLQLNTKCWHILLLKEKLSKRCSTHIDRTIPVSFYACVSGEGGVNFPRAEVTFVVIITVKSERALGKCYCHSQMSSASSFTATNELDSLVIIVYKNVDINEMLFRVLFYHLIPFVFFSSLKLTF